VGEVGESFVDRVKQFLASNPIKAYTNEEIAAQLNPDQQVNWAHILQVGTAIMVPSYNGDVEVRFVRDPNGGNYYYYYYKIKQKSRVYKIGSKCAFFRYLFAPAK
jgi:hypothetical protein